MALGKIVKAAWKWWSKKSTGTKLFIYFFLAWEVLMGLYFLLSN
jgi:hypothetical protein